eukprot:CAMPEP_0175144874 /NCGR_PEP_ID=MMETSP0087-20121206/14417_1 /TAXON_ID=136419 /ORGANISM="Unknown Unknown, Strain D1" /LENGTH=605 /DNA_ID=CAMNT_0016429477 /DNA_START=447 /DNA_END=2261 /DNA_ORIENTATION=-
MASQRQGVRVDTSGLAPVSKKVLREKILEQVIQESIILRDNVQTSMEKTSELQKVVDDLKQRLRLEKTQKVVLEQQLVEAKAAITDLEVANQRQQEISKHALNSKVNEVVELKRLANLNQLKFERAVKQSKMVKGQLSSTISDIDNLQRQVQQKQDVINFKEQEKDRLLYSSERLCELTRAQGEKIMDAKYHNRFSRQREAAALLNEREMKDRFTGVVEELHAKESECNTLSEQLVTTKNELALLGGLWERKFNTAMTKAAAEQADLKIELQQAQDKAVRIQEALQQQKDSYEKTIATLKSNIEEYLQVIETAEKAKSRMQKEIDEFESVRAEDVMKQSNMGAQLRALNQNRQELEAEVKELTKEKTELTEDKERHLAKIEKLNKAVEVMERQSKELKQQLERKEERLQDARSQVESLKEEAANDKERHLDELKAYFDLRKRYKGDVDKYRVELKERNAQVVNLTEGLQKMTKNMQAAKGHIQKRDEENAKLEEQLAQLQQKYMKTKQDLDAASAQVSTLKPFKKMHAAAKKEKDKFEFLAKKREQELSKQEDKVKKVEKKLEDEKAKHKETQQLLAQLQKSDGEDVAEEEEVAAEEATEAKEEG